MYIIAKEFGFEAMHFLTKVPEGHKCRNPHGHSYRVVAEFSSEGLNEYGFVVDYGELRKIRQFIDNTLDHKNINEALSWETGEQFETTAENIARFLFEKFFKWYPTLVAVTVCETASTTATYSPR